MQMTLLRTSLLKWIWTAAQFRLCSTVVTQILQHSCYYLVADECYLLHKIGSNLLKLSDCLGVINGYLIYVIGCFSNNDSAWVCPTEIGVGNRIGLDVILSLSLESHCKLSWRLFIVYVY